MKNQAQSFKSAPRVPTSALVGGLTLSLAAFLAACGGGSGTPSAADPVVLGTVTQSVSGTITGFGSVYVDGVRYDDSLASIKHEDDPVAPRISSNGALRLGMRVELSADDGDRAARIHVVPELQGPVTSKDPAADSFTILGKAIRIVPANTTTGVPTVFEGVADLAALQVGQVVEIHGIPDSADATNNTVIATRVELKTGAAAATLRLTGTLSNPNAGANGSGSFTVGTMTITYNAQTRITPSIDALVAGRKVAIWSDVAASGNTVVAKAISVRSESATDTERFRVSGLPTDLDVAAKTFKLQGLLIDASSAIIKNTGRSLSDLSQPIPVRVKGTVVAGAFKAQEIRFVTEDQDRAGELTGPVTDFVSLSSFKVRGVPVDASGRVEFEKGSANLLTNGVNVKVEGQATDTGIRAKEIKFLP